MNLHESEGGRERGREIRGEEGGRSSGGGTKGLHALLSDLL